MSKTIDLKIDLLKTCLSARRLFDKSGIYFASFGKDPKPNYIKMVITVDLDGDGMLMLPDEKKKLVAEKYYGQGNKVRII